MRLLMALVIGLGLVAASGVVELPFASDGLAPVVAAQEVPSGQIDVDIDTDRGGGAWYTNPLWIAVGVVALIALIAIIVAASRSGGTTIVKE